MSFYSNVAPRRKLRAKREAWACKCPRRVNPSYLTRCTNCGAERP